MNNGCPHGFYIKASCPICDSIQQRDELRAKLAAAEERVAALEQTFVDVSAAFRREKEHSENQRERIRKLEKEREAAVESSAREECEACARIAEFYPVSSTFGARIAAAIRARNLQPCGHPPTAIASSDGGTNYCKRCEAEWAD